MMPLVSYVVKKWPQRRN